MLNKDHLLKIKGILSAKEGTQVPKFQTPAGALPVPQSVSILLKKSPEFQKWMRNKHSDMFQTMKDFTVDTWAQLDAEFAKFKAESQQGAEGNPDTTPDLEYPKVETPVKQLEKQEQMKPLSIPTIMEAAKAEFKPTTIEENAKKEVTAKGVTILNPPTTEFTPVPSQETAPEPPNGNTPENARKEGERPVSVLGDPTKVNQQDLNDLELDPGKAGGDSDFKPKTFSDKVSDVVKSEGMQTAGKIGSAAGLVADVADTFLVDKTSFADDSWENSSGKQTYDAVANSLMCFSPVGTVLGGAMKVGALVNSLGGSKAEKFSADKETIAQVGGSYGGSVANISEAASKAGKKYGLFEGGKRSKANAQIREARRQQSVMSNIAKDAQDSQAASTIMSQVNNFNYQYQMNGGFDQRYMRAAKEGTKIQYFKDPFKVVLSDVSNFEVQLSELPTMFKAGGTLLDTLDKEHTFTVVLSDVPEELERFKQGGNIKDREIEVIETDTNQKSVIPEGALHKNKHHLNEVGVDDSELTKKGIPVVDNQGEQQAEIELNEIIFTLEVTKELESRYKEFYEEGTSSAKKDELAIEAGKLLWKEILYNTDDRTGLIDTLKQGGSLTASKSDKVFEHFVETLPKNLQNSTNYRLKDYWEFNGKPKDFDEAVQKGMFDKLPDGWQARSVAENPKTGEIEYMKSEDHPTRYMESDWYEKGLIYNGDGSVTQLAPGVEGYEDWKDFVTNYELQKTSPYWKYVKRTTPKHKNGGSLSQSDIDRMVRQALINILTHD